MDVTMNSRKKVNRCLHFIKERQFTCHFGGVGNTVDNEAVLRSAGTLLSRVRAPLPALWPVRGPESLRTPFYGLTVYNNQTKHVMRVIRMPKKRKQQT
ncbi:hypothetical protein PoB_004086700 [Plakobranchus ocellatus]|uniref:Uncharacterized protein n=1 Tax=Plakobranchus ocellatus TaxID=259542 RepID=A0AAV4B4C3_9GAST|nr:hypothetical protein PoB_004086700 [Plakobranchus ocellatus]